MSFGRRTLSVWAAAGLLTGAESFLSAAVSPADLAERRDYGALRSSLAPGLVNAAQPDGTTALHWAAHIGNAPVAELLLKAGANPKAVTRDGATPFALACNKGNAGVIELLLAKGEDPNAVLTGEPAIMMRSEEHTSELQSH